MSLRDGIKSAYDASGLASQFAGGYWLDFAPAGTAFPFLSATWLSAPLTQKYGAVTPHAAELVQFSIIGTGASTVGRLATATACALAVPITLDDGVTLNAIQKNRPIPRKQRRIGPDNIDVWMATFDVLYTTQVTE